MHGADSHISVHDLEKSSAYRSTMAEVIAQQIMTCPIDAETVAALARFRGEGIPDQSNVSAQVAPINPASDWLAMLGDTEASDYCALNTDLFLDLFGHLKSLPPSTVDNNRLNCPKAVHRAYAKRALMKIPSLEDYEKRPA